ncbi:MAG: 50S ribosomal protein L11 [Candidatus Aenigmatarchaeota archaeon]|nr:MAG: 50S ribosomal protein L11 [Candidatus Aenigmarchaeota archaeon]
MPKLSFKFLVDAGKATPGPPIGTSLGPLKVNIAKIVEEINNRTKELEGMKVPVVVKVDTETKEFEVEIGTPPVSALIKRELGIEKGSGQAGEIRVGDLTMEQVKAIAKKKFGSDAEPYLKQVIGTARSMGVTVGQGPLTEEEKRKIQQAAKPGEKEEEKAGE